MDPVKTVNTSLGVVRAVRELGEGNIVKGRLYDVLDANKDQYYLKASKGGLYWFHKSHFEPGDNAPEPVKPLDGNPKTLVGQLKPPTSCVPPSAFIYLGQALQDGREKYGKMNWRDDPVTASTYWDAAQRHLLAYWDGEDEADDSQCHHLAHAMGCLAIILDAELNGTLTDDRPKGNVSKLIKDLHGKRKARLGVC